MDLKMRSFKSLNHKSSKEVEGDIDVRKGPWMAEEDNILFNYINSHGEGRWNAVARCSGLKRTGKSCRLRWLNYLRPSVRRGNITLQEQLLILELHFRWGNRWSKIAQYLPGRTDNEIKNYWRTRVQKQAKQLKCDVNSKQFRDAMRYVWMPRLFERIQASTTTTTTGSESNSATDQPPPHLDTTNGSGWVNQDIVPSTSSESISNRVQISPVSNITEVYDPVDHGDKMGRPGMVMEQGYDREVMNGWTGGGESLDSWWNEEDLYWLLQQQIGEW